MFIYTWIKKGKTKPEDRSTLKLELAHYQLTERKRKSKEVYYDMITMVFPAADPLLNDYDYNKADFDYNCSYRWMDLYRCKNIKL